jgi:GTP-binding protein HflX
MEKKVNGNTEGLKKSMLDMLLSIYDDYDDSGCYCTQDTLDKICAVSFHTKREIAVYIDKRDRVILVAVGDSELVRTDYEPVKGMRLIHTHPSGTANLSSVDVETLKNSSLSAMSSSEHERRWQDAYDVLRMS